MQCIDVGVNQHVKTSKSTLGLLSMRNSLFPSYKLPSIALNRLTVRASAFANFLQSMLRVMMYNHSHAGTFVANNEAKAGAVFIPTTDLFSSLVL